MSSGKLPLCTYHRAGALGSGTYGSVVTVYDDDGNEFALKLFLEDNEDDDDDEENEDVGISLGALREISILRLLRHENSHPNIITMHDIQTGFGEDADDAGAGTGGCLSIAMPLFPMGSMLDVIASKAISTKAQKVAIAHGLLNAVAYLHENAILHRDIKSDNVLIQHTNDGSFRAVLIDFSLAKIVDPSVMIPGGLNMMPVKSEESEWTHTPSVGTPTYRAPEVIDQAEYGFPSDLWSVGVCLLELLQGKALEATKDKGALLAISDHVAALPTDQPFPDLIRGMLQKDPSERLTARQALESEVFQKFNMEINPKTFHRIDISKAVPFDSEEEDGQNQTLSIGSGNKKKCIDPVLSKRYQRIVKICHAMEWDNPLTAQAALTYTTQMSELCDMDDLNDTQAFLDCIILAHKFFERHLMNLSELNEAHKVFENWNIEEYVDNEGTLFMILDFCLFPRYYIPTR